MYHSLVWDNSEASKVPTRNFQIMAEEDPWGDLFAKAAEVSTTTIDPVVDGRRHDHEREQEPPSKKRRKQKNKSNKKSQKADSRDIAWRMIQTFKDFALLD